MEELHQQFTAVDHDGKKYPLRVYQERLPVGTRATPSAVAPGQKRIVTEDGESVNRVKKGKYKIVATGVILHSCDPDAP